MSDLRVRSDWMNDPRNLAIALLAVTTLLLGGALGRDRFGGLAASLRGEEPRGESVAVLDVVLDRGGLSYLDFLLDRPVGEDRVGEVLPADAATVRPAVAGTWRWEGANVLRFEPAGGFTMAMRYEFALVGERILPPGRHLRGASVFPVVTDQFQVERVDTYQEPTPEGDGIILRGSARFNYDVDPEMLAVHMRLIDPARGPSDPVPLLFETYYQDRILEFRTEPLRKQRSERRLTLAIAGALTPAVGNVALSADFSAEIVVGSSENLAIWDVEAVPGDPESRLRMRLSSPVDPGAIERHLTVVPNVPYRVSSQRNEVTLTGAFEPGTEYVLTVSDGLPARDDALLRSPYSVSLRVPDIEASLEFESPGMFLAASGNRQIAIEAVNTDLGDLVVERVYRNNLFYLFNSYSWMVWDEESYAGSAIAHSLGDRVAEVQLRTGGPRNRRRRLGLDLADYLDPDAPGLYRVALARRGDYRALQRWIMVTDLGIVAKKGDGGLLVWVSSVDTLDPIGGARVTVISDQNQRIALGTTDARGLWQWQPPVDVQSRAYMLTVERGDDFSFLLFDAMGVDTTGLDVGGAITSATGYEGYLYGERDIYRPGETVEGTGLVRDRLLRVPPAMPLLLRHIDPTGLEGESTRVSMLAGGAAPFELDVPEYARTGRHQLELIAGERVIGRYGFQVEEFVPDRIRVDVEPASARVDAGETLAYEVNSHYLFGPPASGLALETRVRLLPATFAPDGYDGYSFSSGERRFPGTEIYAAEGRLDDSGVARFETGLARGLRVPSSLEAAITARVREEGGRGVAATTRVPVHPYPHYLGLRRVDSGYAEPGQTERFEVVVVGPDGRPATTAAIRMEAFKDEWQTVLRRTPAGTFRYESTRDSRLVDSQVVEAAGGAGAFDMLPEEFGAYRVVVSDPSGGSAAEVTFTASGGGFSPWAIANPARIELDLDRQEYAPGQSARVQIRAPFAGRLLLTVERNGVQWSRTVAMTGNTATIDVPVVEGMRPNAYVTATVVRGARDLQPGSVARAFGAVPISVDRGANRLDVQINHPDEIRPGTTLEVSVESVPGASVTVAAVDEGILQLIAQRTPDPFEFFYRKLALGVGSFDTFSLLLPEVAALDSAAVGGGAAADAMAQYVGSQGIRRATPVSFWSGVLRADARGRATVTFDVPDFQGALRIMAVASEGRRFGSVEDHVTVRDPLVVLPTLPRFLSTGDEVSIPVSVRNDTGRSGEISVALTAAVPGVAEQRRVERLQVADGEEQLAYFALRVGGETGAATIGIEAQGAGESTSTSAEIPVRFDLPQRTDEAVGAITGAVTELPGSTEPFRVGATRSLRIGRVPLVQLHGRLEYLVRYPYGCLEQVTSGAFPLVYLGGLAEQLDPDLFESTGSPSVMVQDAVRRLAGFQTYSGGFSLWAGGDSVQPWASVYATHFLVEARNAGFLVGDALLGRALTFVQGEARARSEYAWDELQRVAYALYVLARAGQADLGTMDFVRQRHASALRAEGRAMLAAAYAAIGNPSATRELLVAASDATAVVRETGGNFNSEVRNRALSLLALQQADPGDTRIAELARRLVRDAAALEPWSTQETAFVLLALGQFYADQVAQGEYGGRVVAGDDEVARFDSSADLVTTVAARGPLRIEMDPGFAGGAWYSLRTRGVPTDAGYRPEQSGIELRRDFLTRAGRAADLDAVRQGDLLAIRLRLRSISGALENVVVQTLLPAGLEVENPRLSSSETLAWIVDANLEADHLDIRDDRVLIFASLPDDEWRTAYVLVRAVSPGRFRVPPVQAEAMYEPAIRASVDRGRIRILQR